MFKRNVVLGWMMLNITLVMGCLGPDPSGPTENETSGKLPKMKFHRPRSFKSAIVRLVEIHDSIQAQQAEPEPLMFQVIEVIHSNGKNAHSHFYLERSADDSEPAEIHEEGHEDMMESRKHHKVYIPISIEFADLVRWLPSVAAGSDLEENAWNEVVVLSKQIEEALNLSPSPEPDYAKFRTAYLMCVENVETCLSKLSKLSGDSGNE